MHALSRALAILLGTAFLSPVTAQGDGAGAGAETPVDALTHASELQKSGDLEGARAAVEAVIEAQPDLIAAHDLLRELVSRRSRDDADRSKSAGDALIARYEEWAKRFPRSSGVHYGLGAFFSSREDPRAKPWLLAAVERDPKLAKAFQMLSIDAERWGDEQAARDFMLRAARAEPDNPDYAFYHASSLQHVDRKQWVDASLAVAERFPKSERGAQALYWLGERADTEAKRIEFWEQARAKFPAATFRWTRSAMDELFEAYLRTAPDRALALAKDMTDADRRGRDAWSRRVKLADDYMAARRLLDAGSFADAVAITDRIKVERRSRNAGMLTLLKAEATAGNGNVQAAYDALVARQAGTPEDEVRAALVAYGAKLGKDAEQVDADVRARRDADAKPAPPFTLQRYGSDAKVSLADYRGKVVLLTFWFPGCGPCRGEFPHFENVLAKFRGRDVVYLGINGLTEQDDYVLPFMAGTKYTFTPLRADETVTKPEAYAVRGYPSNFLIGRDGKIAYRGFMIHGDTEILLQRMIESLLDAPAAGG